MYLEIILKVLMNSGGKVKILNVVQHLDKNLLHVKQ